MIKFSLSVPRRDAQLVADLFKLNGFEYELVQRDNEPSTIIVDVDETAAEAFNPRESIAPRANA